jgi:NADH dehydrogenase FAD-containing subunit
MAVSHKCRLLANGYGINIVSRREGRMKKTSIVIAGGGFAGLSAAMYLDKTLARRAEAEVTMISRENFILFTRMLREVAAGDLSQRKTSQP